MIGIKLTANMDCANICQRAQNIITRYIQENGASEDLMLVLQIQKVQEGKMDLTKKLNYIENPPSSP
jgi:hypothetical protein